MAAVARRMLICGMHVHVGLPDSDMRIDLMNQVSYFLPHLLALSASSPFWQAEDTGLSSYRTTVFGDMPRTGLPPSFDSFAELQANMILEVPALGEEGLAAYGDLPKGGSTAKAEGRITAYPIEDFYLTNPIARASAVMQQCSSELLGSGELAEAAE